MSILGGLVGAMLSAICAAALAQPTTSNLDPLPRAIVLAILLGVAALLGLITGSAVGRRSRVAGSSIRLFSALAGAVCGGLLGGATAFTLTAAYMREYATWPSATLDVVLALVALPVLGALGLCLGAITGFGVGGLSGIVLGVVVPKRR